LVSPRYWDLEARGSLTGERAAAASNAACNDYRVRWQIKGTWNGTRKAAAIMRQQKSGAIVNISSLPGKVDGGPDELLGRQGQDRGADRGSGQGDGIAAGTLRDDVRPEDVVAMVVGALNATSLVGGREQLTRMFDLVIDAVTRPETRTK
jgi:hypothetical protein